MEEFIQNLPNLWADIAQFIQNNQWLAPILGVIVALLTIGRKFIWKVIQRVLTKIEEKLDQKVDKFSDWLVDGLVNFVVQLWWTLTSNFQGKYYQSLINAYREDQTQGLKTRGPFVLNLEKVFVPLRVAPESLEKISAAIIRHRDDSKTLSIWDFLAEAQRQPTFRRIAVIGPPGSGKTTMLKHLTLTYAQRSQRRQSSKPPNLIPVLVYLRDVREIITSEHPPSLVELIHQQKLVQRLNPNLAWFENKLNRGKCLVMLDGLDEVADDTQRQQVGRWVSQQMEDYPVPFILTSRPSGYRSAPVEQVSAVIEVQPFNLLQMQEFISNWYLQNEILSHLGKDNPMIRRTARDNANDLIHRIRNTPPLAAMALNPLLLTMIATVHRFQGALPGHRVELYAEICDVLLGRRQDAKGIPDLLTVTQKKAVLQTLALELMKQKTREFSLALGNSLIHNKLTTVVGNKINPEQFLEQVENTSGLLLQRERGVYEFAHKSFQEYLAATEISQIGEEGILIENIDESWWDETLRLYVAQSDATNLICTALSKSTITTLAFVYDCLEENVNMQPDLRRQLEGKLEFDLESNDLEIAELAAKVHLSRRLGHVVSN